MSEPLSCRYCHLTEPNEFVFSINHGTMVGRDCCMTQYLRRNHVVAMTRGATKPEQIEEYLDRAIEVWRDRLDQRGVEAARARVEAMRKSATVPEHGPVAESVEVSLW